MTKRTITSRQVRRAQQMKETQNVSRKRRRVQTPPRHQNPGSAQEENRTNSSERQTPVSEQSRVSSVPVRPTDSAKTVSNNRRRGWMLWMVAVVAILIGIALAFFAEKQRQAEEQARSASALAASASRVAQSIQEEEKIGPKDPDLWSLLLANTTHPLPEGYEPELASVGYDFRGIEQFVDERVQQPLLDMLKAAEEDGVYLQVRSAYRSHENQTVLFESMKQDYMAQGYTEEQAYAATKRWRNVPGTSEHETGLAADIVEVGYGGSLDESLEQTEEAKWLYENAADFGFVLRYPKDKTDITGTSFEPWHYRYVGVEDAKKIMAEGLCLEEYLGMVE
ncbi:M15 family metallopeptidase [uncultured Ruthenibacterium sp.]|uniref:M15 family metallopeptidase n=1 Tax=uncultured Ruthenibacterium sp. TaxID=1905347 RepID=UPI00349EC4E7